MDEGLEKVCSDSKKATRLICDCMNLNGVSFEAGLQALLNMLCCFVCAQSEDEEQLSEFIPVFTKALYQIWNEKEVTEDNVDSK